MFIFSKGIHRGKYFAHTKLKGAAFKAIQYMRTETWDEMKEHLQRRFGIGEHITYIEREFTVISQKSNESVAEFGEKVCSLTGKITEYNVKEKNTKQRLLNA